MKMLSLDEFRHFRDSGEPFSLVNVLPSSDFGNTNIPGSINVPLEEPNFIDRVSTAVGDRRDAPVVTYCMSEDCPASTRAAEQLESAGFTDVYDFKGGWKDWEAAHRDEEQESTRRPVRAKGTEASGTAL